MLSFNCKHAKIDHKGNQQHSLGECCFFFDIIYLNICKINASLDQKYKHSYKHIAIQNKEENFIQLHLNQKCENYIQRIDEHWVNGEESALEAT